VEAILTVLALHNVSRLYAMPLLRCTIDDCRTHYLRL
jgi:hypothetical protein